MRTVTGLVRSMARGMTLVLVVLAAWTGTADAQQGMVSFERDSLVLRTADGAEETFDIELALSPQQQAQGLMYRRSLPADAGMLFVYRPARPVSMWMKNTLIPLDMLFIGADRRIAHIVERTVPLSTETISSIKPVSSVLELNAGTVSRLGIKPGDAVASPALGN